MPRIRRNQNPDCFTAFKKGVISCYKSIRMTLGVASTVLKNIVTLKEMEDEEERTFIRSPGFGLNSNGYIPAHAIRRRPRPRLMLNKINNQHRNQPIIPTPAITLSDSTTTLLIQPANPPRQPIPAVTSTNQLKRSTFFLKKSNSDSNMQCQKVEMSPIPKAMKIAKPQLEISDGYMSGDEMGRQLERRIIRPPRAGPSSPIRGDQSKLALPTMATPGVSRKKLALMRQLRATSLSPGPSPSHQGRDDLAHITRPFRLTKYQTVKAGEGCIYERGCIWEDSPPPRFMTSGRGILRKKSSTEADSIDDLIRRFKHVVFNPEPHHVRYFHSEAMLARGTVQVDVHQTDDQEEKKEKSGRKKACLQEPTGDPK